MQQPSGPEATGSTGGAQKLPRRGPPLPSTRPRPDDPPGSVMPVAVNLMGSHQHGVNAGAGDSLSELLHKPLLPQNGALYARLADQMLEPQKSRGRGARPAAAEPTPNYDDEARKLWARLNLDPNKGSNSQFNSLDAIWRHPETGGTIYVGNEVAAKSLQMLKKHNISHVVNCTDSIPCFHEHQPDRPITYFRFDITSHYQRARTEDQAVVFAQPMLNFVTDALSKGKNVMVHCLAGAHRAGTTGIMCLMHFATLSAKDATVIAKQLRPIIDPICDFPMLLAKLERGWCQRAGGG